MIICSFNMSGPNLFFFAAVAIQQSEKHRSDGVEAAGKNNGCLMWTAEETAGSKDLRSVYCPLPGPDRPQTSLVVTATRRSPLLFVPTRVKLNSEQYVSDIMKGCLVSWAEQHFKDKWWTLQQDSAPSHGSKFTQSSILRKISSFISKKDWPAQSPDLNPLDYSIWSIVEKRVCSTPHQTLESLKAKLMKEWDTIPQKTLRATCNSFPDRLKAIVKNKGSYMEQSIYHLKAYSLSY